jgi:hypothetical protein
MRIRIEGEWKKVESIEMGSYLPMLVMEVGGEEYYVAETHEKAGEAARQYWKEMAENDPKEFIVIVGEENLVAWGLGQLAGPGSTAVQSLEEWLDLYLDAPEEEFASYDGIELALNEDDTDGALQGKLGFVPEVAYRHN